MNMNISNHTFTNETRVPTQMELINLYLESFTFNCVPNLFGTYFLYHIIQYLKEKAPNQKTLLDGHYVHLFASWIIIGWLMMLNDIAILTSLSQFELICDILGWASYFSFLLCDFYLILGCGIRFFLIFFSHVIEDVNDDLILFTTG